MRNSYERFDVQQTLCLHPVLPLMAAASALCLPAFAAWLLYRERGLVDARGRLAFVSDSIELHCGLTATVFGGVGATLAVCMLVAGAHAGSRLLLCTTLAFLITWEAMLGVAETGWLFHDVCVNLCMLMLLTFHWHLSTLPPWSHRSTLMAVYRMALVLAALAAVVFLVGGIVRKIANHGEGADAHQSYVLTYNVSCVAEYVLICCLSVAHLAFAAGLNAYVDVRLLFRDKE